MKSTFIGFFKTIFLPFRKSLRVKLIAASIIVVLFTVIVITAFGYTAVYTILKERMGSRIWKRNSFGVR